jgi:HEAT repeat protein
MKVKYRPVSRLAHPIVFVCLVFVLLAWPSESVAHDEWFRDLDLEPVLSEASLVLVGRVADVSSTVITTGGKGEFTLLQFKFVPVLTLKGVFSRESLSLTSADIGIQGISEAAPIETGQLRLLILGRSMEGYAVLRQSSSLEQAVPLLRDSNDALLESVKVLLAVNANQERPEKVMLLLEGIRKQRGPAVIPLLAALERRSLLASQAPGAVASIAPHLIDPSPAVREQAATTVYSLLRDDYLEQPELRESAVKALAAVLEMRESNFAPRVAAFDALGAAGPKALENKAAKAELEHDPPATFAEEGARLRAVGELRMHDQESALVTLLRQMPLDAPPTIQSPAEWALARLNPSEGGKEITVRSKSKYDAGLPVTTETNVLGDLPSADAASALLEISKLNLDDAERYAFASASKKVVDPRLVAPLAGMLASGQQDVRWAAVEALIKINTDDAAKALQPHLREERDLSRKLELAEFLGRHGIRDGYPYAIEHMSEPSLREEAISALAAIREPRAVGGLRKILETSNDADWNRAAIRSLGRLGAVELAPQFLEIARNAKNPLAPSALIALGDLHEAKALEIARAGFASRDTEIVTASARAAGNLLALATVKADDVRGQLALLLADPGSPEEARTAALESLLALNDSRLNGALVQAVCDARLEGGNLLGKIEKLLRERKVRITRVRYQTGSS